eukprot:535298-Karenia_brevis.AAC.1
MPAPGPMTETVADSSRTAFQWRQLGMRFEELMQCLRSGRCAPITLALGIKRHLMKAIQLVRAMGKCSLELAVSSSI